MANQYSPLNVAVSYLPYGVIEFWHAFPKESLPYCADAVFQIVNTAVRKQTARAQRKYLNNEFRGLKRHKQKPLEELKTWLVTPAVADAATVSGLQWALLKWQIAVYRMVPTPCSYGPQWKSSAAHAAFGGNKPGRPARLNFKGAELVAAYVRCFPCLNLGTAEKMIERWQGAAAYCDERSVDERDVRHILRDKGHFVHSLSYADLWLMALGDHRFHPRIIQNLPEGS